MTEPYPGTYRDPNHKIIGKLALNSPAGAVPLVGHLRSDGHDSVLVTVRSTDTEANLRESLHWRDDEITYIRRWGTSNKVRLTFSGKPSYVLYDALLIPVPQYRKTVPVCGLCGAIGHRPGACPGPIKTSHLRPVRLRRCARRRRARTSQVCATVLSLYRSPRHRGPYVHGPIPCVPTSAQCFTTRAQA